MQKVREQTEYEITCWQRAGLVVLKSLKLSGVSLILFQKQNIEHAVLQNVHFSLLSTMNVTIWQNFCLNWSIL